MIIVSFLVQLSFGVDAQVIDPAILQQPWKAQWITVPGASNRMSGIAADPALKEYGVYKFRKRFEMADKPSSFVVHVSADNRYKLYVNGELASLGPARGDLNHWNFETVDIAVFLKTGENIIAALVWNEAGWRPEAQISLQTGFILQGATAAEQLVNSNDSWKGIRDESFQPIKVNLSTYYVAGPGELIDMQYHIKHWKEPAFPDSLWKNAQSISPGLPKGMIGGYGTIAGWMLVPSGIPPMELKEQRFLQLRKADGVIVPSSFPAEKTRITIPANTVATLLLDQSFLTNAYPTLQFSGGKSATVTLTYAEALFSKYPEKGNRDEVEGKFMMGRKDSLISDGSSLQEFTSLNWRTYRYMELRVTTKAEPLVIADIYGTFTGYPFEYKAKLESGLPELNTILNTGWRTARLCAVETYMDCPYYEQLQYIGDSRIQGLVSLYNSGDDRLLKNALNLMDYSRQPEGVTLSRHPSYTPQYIPTFSLWYIGMLHDYWMYAADTNFIMDKLAGARQVLHYFRGYQQADGSLRKVPHWMFTDWVTANGWQAGRGPMGKDGGSAMLDLQLLWAYQLAAAMESRAGIMGYAARYNQYADQLKSTIRKKYWDDTKKLFADRSEKDLFSQHTNSLAILTGIVTGNEAAIIAKQLLEDSTLAPASIYFKYYLHLALTKAGLGNNYLDWLGKWRENMALGLTTWGESSDVSTTRSDCHAWGASPNIEFFRTILGIDSDAPGFVKVKIAPHLGDIQNISGEIPHPKGKIAVQYSNANGLSSAVIMLPEGVTGRFIWNGRNYPLKPGRNAINLTKSAAH